MQNAKFKMQTTALAAALLFALFARPLGAATDHVGRVTLSGGAPVPGARVTATQGGTTLTTTTDVQGAYRLPALADGTWSIEVAMVGFSTQRRDVTVGTGAASPTWELSVMPFAEITRGISVPPPAPPIDRRAAAQRNQGRAGGPAGPADTAFQRAGVAPAPPVISMLPVANSGIGPASPIRGYQSRPRPARAVPGCGADVRRGATRASSPR